MPQVLWSALLVTECGECDSGDASRRRRHLETGSNKAVPAEAEDAGIEDTDPSD